MIHALWTAASGMQAMKFKIDVIANNISNSNTDGFKRAEVEFSDLLYQYLKKPGTDSPTGTAYGLGTRIAGTTTQHRQGPLQQTERNLDWAIDGVGFFTVINPLTSEKFFTRKGEFKINNQGQITNSDGFLLEPAVAIPQGTSDFHVALDGIVWANQPGSGLLQQIGQITIARFANPSGLEAMGKSLYRETVASGNPEEAQPGQQGFGTIQGRALESSNVEIVREMVDLISTQKAFDTNSKIISVSDKMMDTANNLSR